MRTTVSLADDVAAAVQRLRKERSIGLSEAVNELIRAGLTKRQVANRFQQQTYDMGEGIDYSNIGDAIETLDGPASGECSLTQTSCSMPSTSVPRGTAPRLAGFRNNSTAPVGSACRGRAWPPSCGSGLIHVRSRDHSHLPRHSTSST